MLRLLLCNELKSAIPQWEDTATEGEAFCSLATPSVQSPVWVRNVSLKRVEDTAQIAYVSAIALQQAASQQSTSMQLATRLVENLCQTRSKTQALSTFADIGLESFSIRVIPPGFIWFELSDRGIATVLQLLLHKSDQLRPFIPPAHLVNGQVTSLLPSLPEPAGEVVFSTQYVHARCCSLLRLAHQQGIVTLALNNVDSSESMFWRADPVPWLESVNDRPPSLRLQHPAERFLINQVVWVLDELCLPTASDPSPEATRISSKWLQRFDRLNQAFQTFHQECRIFGLGQEGILRAQTRLGLVQVVQRVLQFTLEERFGMIAPIEL